jgi:hypothetical protein
MAVRSYVLDIYGTHLHLATKPKQWRRLARKYDNLIDQNDSPGSVTLFVDTEALNRIHLAVWVDVAAHDGDGAQLIETVAHEATHAAAQLLDHIGQPPGDSEALAYLTGWLTRWLWEAVT